MTIKTTSLRDAQKGAAGKVEGNKPASVYPPVSTGLDAPLSSITNEHVKVSNAVLKDSATLASDTSRESDEERNEFEEEVSKYYHYFDASSVPTSDSSKLAGNVRSFMNLLENKTFELARDYIKGVIASVTVNNNSHERNRQRGNGTPSSLVHKSLSASVAPLRRDNEERDDIAAPGTKTKMNTGKINGKRDRKGKGNELEGKIVENGLKTNKELRERYFTDEDKTRDSKMQDMSLTKGIITGRNIEIEDRRRDTGERKERATTKTTRKNPSLNPWLLIKVRKIVHI